MITPDGTRCLPWFLGKILPMPLKLFLGYRRENPNGTPILIVKDIDKIMAEKYRIEGNNAKFSNDDAKTYAYALAPDFTPASYAPDSDLPNDDVTEQTSAEPTAVTQEPAQTITPVPECEPECDSINKEPSRIEVNIFKDALTDIDKHDTEIDTYLEDKPLIQVSPLNDSDDESRFIELGNETPDQNTPLSGVSLVSGNDFDDTPIVEHDSSYLELGNEDPDQDSSLSAVSLTSGDNNDDFGDFDDNFDLDAYIIDPAVWEPIMRDYNAYETMEQIQKTNDIESAYAELYDDQSLSPIERDRNLICKHNADIRRANNSAGDEYLKQLEIEDAYAAQADHEALEKAFSFARDKKLIAMHQKDVVASVRKDRENAMRVHTSDDAIYDDSAMLLNEEISFYDDYKKDQKAQESSGMLSRKKQIFVNKATRIMSESFEACARPVPADLNKTIRDIAQGKPDAVVKMEALPNHDKTVEIRKKKISAAGDDRLSVQEAVKMVVSFKTLSKGHSIRAKADYDANTHSPKAIADYKDKNIYDVALLWASATHHDVEISNLNELNRIRARNPVLFDKAIADYITAMTHKGNDPHLTVLQKILDNQNIGIASLKQIKKSVQRLQQKQAKNLPSPSLAV